jgi:3-deoxy-7-phosphoheptulonate synthase
MSDVAAESSMAEAFRGPARPQGQTSHRCLVARSGDRRRTVVTVAGVEFGAGTPIVIAGPCSVESYEQTRATAQAVEAAGAAMLRGGAFKPRTSPYDFQGLGPEALEILHRVKVETGLPVVSEVLSTDDIAMMADLVDMLQVGARNMQNFALLRRLGQTRKPILLKRSPAATVKEWLLAAEYILAGGNDQVVLCERGIRSYDPEMRNTLDIAGMALARRLTHLPVIADPSHGAGRRDLIPGLSSAALAAGADGLIIEVHPDPANALSDGLQSLDFAGFARLMEACDGARNRGRVASDECSVENC